MIISDAGQFVIATPTKCGTTTLEHIAKRPINAGQFDIVRSDRERAEVFLEVAGQDDDGYLVTLDSRRRQHRMAMPYDAESFKPYLLTRNPASRWVSVYEYLRAPQNYSQWGARAVQGSAWASPDESKPRNEWDPMSFEEFLRFVVAMREENPRRSKKRGKMKFSKSYRSPWVWLDGIDFSIDMLEHNTQRRVKFVRLENLDKDLTHLAKKFNLTDVDLTTVKANRTKNPLKKHWTDYWTKSAVKVAEKKLGIVQECERADYEWKGGKK